MIILLFIIYLAHSLADDPHTKWMHTLNNNSLISQVTIPGTRESCAYSLSNGKGNAQTLSLQDQLETGIRYLDFRLDNYLNLVRVLDDGTFVQTSLTFSSAQPILTQFLDTNPSEFFILRIQQVNASAFHNFTTQLAAAMNINYYWPNATLPIVGDIRGKIFILQDFVGLDYFLYNSSILSVYDLTNATCDLGSLKSHIQNSMQSSVFSLTYLGCQNELALSDVSDVLGNRNGTMGIIALDNANVDLINQVLGQPELASIGEREVSIWILITFLPLCMLSLLGDELEDRKRGSDFLHGGETFTVLVENAIIFATNLVDFTHFYNYDTPKQILIVLPFVLVFVRAITYALLYKRSHNDLAKDVDGGLSGVHLIMNIIRMSLSWRSISLDWFAALALMPSVIHICFRLIIIRRAMTKTAYGNGLICSSEFALTLWTAIVCLTSASIGFSSASFVLLALRSLSSILDFVYNDPGKEQRRPGFLKLDGLATGLGYAGYFIRKNKNRSILFDFCALAFTLGNVICNLGQVYVYSSKFGDILWTAGFAAILSIVNFRFIYLFVKYFRNIKGQVSGQAVFCLLEFAGIVGILVLFQRDYPDFAWINICIIVFVVLRMVLSLGLSIYIWRRESSAFYRNIILHHPLLFLCSMISYPGYSYENERPPRFFRHWDKGFVILSAAILIANNIRLILYWHQEGMILLWAVIAIIISIPHLSSLGHFTVNRNGKNRPPPANKPRVLSIRDSLVQLIRTISLMSCPNYFYDDEREAFKKPQPLELILIFDFLLIFLNVGRVLWHWTISRAVAWLAMATGSVSLIHFFSNYEDIQMKKKHIISLSSQDQLSDAKLKVPNNKPLSPTSPSSVVSGSPESDDARFDFSPTPKEEESKSKHPCLNYLPSHMFKCVEGTWLTLLKFPWAWHVGFVFYLIFMFVPVQMKYPTNNDWLKYQNNQISVSQIFLPGTHDSSTWNTWPYLPQAVCQTLALDSQLGAGVRFFDLRVYSHQETLYVVHGTFYTFYVLDRVFDWFRTFLEDHPTEFIVTRLSVDRQSDDTAHNFTTDFQKLNQTFFWNSTAIPSVEQARQRIIILVDHGDFPNSPYIDYKSLMIEDMYSLDNCNRTSINQKKDVITQNLQSSGNSGVWALTFTSAVATNINILACTPLAVAIRINSWLRNEVLPNTVGASGILANDFSDFSLAPMVIGNYRDDYVYSGSPEEMSFATRMMLVIPFFSIMAIFNWFHIPLGILYLEGLANCFAWVYYSGLVPYGSDRLRRTDAVLSALLLLGRLLLSVYLVAKEERLLRQASEANINDPSDQNGGK